MTNTTNHAEPMIRITINTDQNKTDLKRFAPPFFIPSLLINQSINKDQYLSKYHKKQIITRKKNNVHFRRIPMHF